VNGNYAFLIDVKCHRELGVILGGMLHYTLCAYAFKHQSTVDIINESWYLRESFIVKAEWHGRKD